MSKEIFINIHGHRPANNIHERVVENQMARDYPPDDMEHGYYSVGFHPYNLGKLEEEEGVNRVRLATENIRVVAIGEIGLDKHIDFPLDGQYRVFKAQVEIAEYADLPVILHVVRAFNEMMEFMQSHKPAVPMIIHGYNGSAQMAEDLVRAGFYLSFGEAIAREHSKIVEALPKVPLERLFLETDEGDLDIREIYAFASEILGITVQELTLQIQDNVKSCFSRFQMPS